MSLFRKSSKLPLSATIPPVKALHRRLAVFASAAGLIIRPTDERQTAVRIPWGRNTAPESVQEWGEDAEDGLLAIGIGGLLQGPSGAGSFLILIMDTAVAAALFDSRRSQIHSVTSLLAIPLADFSSANDAITKHATKAAAARQKRAASVSTVGTATEEGTDGSSDAMSSDDETDTEADARPQTPDVTVRKQPFWQKPFVRRTPAKPAVVLTDSTAKTSPPQALPDASDVDASSVAPAPAPETVEAAVATSPDKSDADVARSQAELDQKVVSELLRTMNGLYFSFDLDVTRSYQRKHDLIVNSAGSSPQASPSAFLEPQANLPLWRRADRRFWWNRHLTRPFVEAGLHQHVLVLQQGFVRQAAVSLPMQPYSTIIADTPKPADTPAVSLDLIIVSRRSVERPGLRYQRRGVNQEGGVANFVETEFLAGVTVDDKLHVSSFVQTRGSIPVFWKQIPWALKPAPVLDRTRDESLSALTKHFETQQRLYGRQLVVNLAETTGKESAVVTAYRDGVAATQPEELVKYIEFDFHHECRGMKYENIGKLIKQLEPDLEEMQCFWAGDDRVFTSQVGAIRTNCIDCLDRTNVVQSAISRWVLNRQLVHLGIISQEVSGYHDELDAVFNGLWADNGDRISLCYAGTSALKGDFTRTGKRDWRGALNDANNSVARLLLSTSTDFFRQATLDYVLGVNSKAFVEFAERLDSSDPSALLRLAKIREEAVDTAKKEVLQVDEEFIAGWTLLSPTETDVVRSPKAKYEEKVLLLSSKAAYVCSYEFSLQKVVGFIRIPVGDILSLRTGAFILSAVDGATTDPIENYGFIINFRAESTTERVHTYTTKSLRLSRSVSSSSIAPVATLPPRFVAFKALRRESVQSNDGQSRIIDRKNDEGSRTAKDWVLNVVVPTIREECEKIGATDPDDAEFVVEKDLISVAEARSQTTFADRLSRQVLKAIWW